MLDTARGSPAEGVCITLERKADGSADAWEEKGSSVTNSDGRVPNLLSPAPSIEAGTYRSTPKLHCEKTTAMVIVKVSMCICLDQALIREAGFH